MHLKPKASMLVYESIIMNVRNKTSEWWEDLSVTDRETVMEYARKIRQQWRLVSGNCDQLVKNGTQIKLR